MIIVALFLIMYGGAKQNILNVWENNVLQTAKSTEYYLARPADAIEFSAGGLWLRMQLIVVDRDAQGCLNRII